MKKKATSKHKRSRQYATWNIKRRDYLRAVKYAKRHGMNMVELGEMLLQKIK